MPTACIGKTRVTGKKKELQMDPLNCRANSRGKTTEEIESKGNFPCLPKGIKKGLREVKETWAKSEGVGLKMKSLR